MTDAAAQSMGRKSNASQKRNPEKYKADRSKAGKAGAKIRWDAVREKAKAK